MVYKFVFYGGFLLAKIEQNYCARAFILFNSFPNYLTSSSISIFYISFSFPHFMYDNKFKGSAVFDRPPAMHSIQPVHIVDICWQQIVAVYLTLVETNVVNVNNHFGQQRIVNNMVFDCKLCKYRTNRSENLNRHAKSHSKEKIKCECGKWISPAALWRHKKTGYHINNTKQAPDVEKTIEPNEFVNEKVFKVDSFSVRIESKDDQISVQHAPIVIDGMQLMLVPVSSIISMENVVINDANFTGRLIE